MSSSNHIQKRRHPGFIDPRAEKDFDSRFYPVADGCQAPSPESEDRDDRIKLEFCSVYYRLNRLHARLSALQTHAGSLPDESQERSVLQQIEEYLRIRDELEDRYAPLGVIAEAFTRDGFTIDIKFTFGDRNVLRQQRAHFVSSRALLFSAAPDVSVSEAVPGDPETRPLRPMNSST